MRLWSIMFFLIMGSSISAQEGNTRSDILDKVKPIATIQSGAREVPVVMFDGLKPLLEQRDGKIHIINFWASWCKPCIEELPHFKQLAESSGDEVTIVLVSLDFRSKAEAELIPFLDKHDIHLPVVLLSDADANVWIEKVDPGWTGAIPATLVYRNDHREFYETAFTMETLKDAVQSAAHQP